MVHCLAPAMRPLPMPMPMHSMDGDGCHLNGMRESRGDGRKAVRRRWTGEGGRKEGKWAGRVREGGRAEV